MYIAIFLSVFYACFDFANIVCMKKKKKILLRIQYIYDERFSQKHACVIYLFKKTKKYIIFMQYVVIL